MNKIMQVTYNLVYLVYRVVYTYTHYVDFIQCS